MNSSDWKRAASGFLTMGLSEVFYQPQKDALAEQQRANNFAISQAQKQAEAADRQFNELNKKKPNTLALLLANRLAGGGGASGTLLTGVSGAQGSTLGKKTLLGQ